MQSVFYLLTGFLLGIIFGFWAALRFTGDWLINEGVAEWRVNPKTGKRQFKLKKRDENG